MRLDINSDAAVIYTNELEKLGKSALPVAVRETLNSAVFAMKKTAVPKHAKLAFEERQPNFFNYFTRYDKAQGFNINSMVATVGMDGSKLKNNATNYAVRDLEEQEKGGTIHGRSFKPLPAARKGGTGNVRANARISQILKAGNIIDAKDSKGENTMQKFIRASIHAGEGGYVLGGRILWQVKRIARIGRNTFFTKTKLYSFTKSGTATVHATGFMKKAANEVVKEMEFFYKLQAMKQVNKALGKFR